ncbi:MAG: RagB/SusD family nutrient uptake outer membrane protein [Flavobacterium sp.]|nr:MAG: RagB/SusD family nutrient uptake outer membrane protein [Flavobacterium sp.]
MKTKYLLLLLFALSLSSCEKFLEVKPRGILIPEKMGDYEALLNAPSMTRTFPLNLLDFTDDYLNAFETTNSSPAANGYYWRRIITVNERISPDVWGPLYRTIYSANVIINGIQESTEGSDVQKNSIRAEALFVRANCYLDLLTVFAKAYNPTTASTDPGLPLITTTDVNDKSPNRSSVKATLDYIIADLKQAVESLPVVNINRYRVTKHAAYGLLSRVYLYMGDYQNAKIYTDLALQGPHNILNYNSYATKAGVPVYDLNPEVLWQRAAFSGSVNFMLYTNDLKTYFNNDDIRYVFLTVTNIRGLGRSTLPGNYSFGIGYPELYLTKAELLARDGKSDEAIAVVNFIRKNRIRTAVYADQTASSPADALTKVLDERRRELAFSGLRWFDMKRLDQEGRMLEVKRINPTTGTVDATLAPKDSKYTFEIPTRVLGFNPDMQANF